MATFRQEQIDEILNYERSLNRKIYDTEILAVSRMNDERNPPSNRDIKFEALLGGLVDKLKQTIAEAVQSVASKQYPSLNPVNSAKILALNTGVKGVRAAPPNSEQQEQNRLASEATKKALDDARKGVSLAQSKSGTSAAGPSVDLPTVKSGIPPVEGEEETDSDDSNVSDDSDESDDEILIGGPAKKVKVKGAGKPIRARHQGFGADFVKRRKIGGAGKEGETTEQSETAKSEKSMTKTTENILYDCVGQFNGIIDKLLEATQQNGLYKNKRLASASNIQYYANVLKGLMEPFKHLMFELAQVQQPETASLFNMVAKIVDIIDISPPFQKVDVLAYRNGKPDFQGFNDDLVLNDYSGYLTKLETAKDDYVKRVRQFDNAAIVHKESFANVDEKYKTDLFREIAAKQKIAKGVLEKLQGEIISVKKKISSPLFNISDALDKQVLDDVKKSSTMLMETIGSKASDYGWVTFDRPDLTREEVASMRVYKKEEQLARADIIAKQIAKQQENIRKMIDIAIKQGGLEDDVTHSHRKAYEEAADRLQKDLTDFEAVNNLPTYRSEKAARVAAAYAKKQAELEAQKEKDAGGEGEEEGAEKDAQGALNVDKGEGREADASGEAPEVEGDEDDDDEEDEEDEDDEDDEDEDDDDDDDGEFVLDESDDAVIEARYKLNSMSRAKLVETAAREGLEIYSGQPAPKRGPNKGKAPSKTSLQLINELLHEYFAPTKDYDEDAEEDSEDEVKFGGPAKKTDEYEEDSEDETTADEAGDDDDDDGDEKQTRKAKVDALDNAIAQKIEELNDINDVYYSRGTKPREGVDLKQYKPQTDKAFKELLTLIDGYILSRKIAAGEGDYDEGYTLPLPSRIPAKLTDSDLFLKAEEKYQDGMDKINAMVKDNKSSKSGKGKPLANLLANPKQQYNRMGRPVSNDDKINNEMIKMNKKWQNNNPRHENPVGSLYPFKSKTSDARYDFPTELRYERNISHPTKDARGADYSLLQGEIGGPTVNKEVKRQYKPSQRQVVTPAQALQNVLSGAGKKSGALKKLVFDDEANDMYGEGMHSRNQGFIPEDKEDHFKLPDLKKKKEKEMAAKLSGRRK